VQAIPASVLFQKRASSPLLEPRGKKACSSPFHLSNDRCSVTVSYSLWTDEPGVFHKKFFLRLTALGLGGSAGKNSNANAAVKNAGGFVEGAHGGLFLPPGTYANGDGFLLPSSPKIPDNGVRSLPCQPLVEPNSELGKAIADFLKHWEKLTRFCHVPGSPLENNLCERALKRVVLHRKMPHSLKPPKEPMWGIFL